MDTNRIKGRGDSFFLSSSPNPHLTQQCGSVFEGGEVSTFLEKSRKNKPRMGCVGSDGEDELRLGRRTSTTNNRFKFPKKLLKDDCSTVCHVSVPRKLRSAMKKRSYKSVSPPLPVCKKLNHVADGVELLRKDGSMKSKLKMKKIEAQGCVTEVTQGLVTKDEEEVAEALYALAGVFCNAVKTDKARSAGQGLGANSSNLTIAESFLTPIDGGKVEEEIKTVSYRDEAPNHLSNSMRSAGEPVLHHCQDDTRQPDISVGKQAPTELGSDIPEVNLPLTALDSETQQINHKGICDSAVSGDWSELSKTRSKLPNLEKSLASVKYPMTVLTPTAAACSQAAVQRTIKETGNNGSSLRPHLSSAISCDTLELGVPLQSRSAWFESISCLAQSPTSKSSVITKKDAQVAVDSKNSWKRCSTHVYISRFIKVFQITETKNKSMMHSTELEKNDAPKQVANTSVVDLTGGRNSKVGVDCSGNFSGSTPEKNATDVRNAILLHKRLIQDQQQASAPYQVYTERNQSLDFLSLPAGSSQLETSNGITRAGNGLEISTQLRFGGLLSQNQPPIPFPVPPNCIAAVQKVQVPPYVRNTSYGPIPMDATASSLKQLEQQQQKRASLLMAHYKSVVASPTIPNKQTEAPDFPPVFQHVQTLFPPSLSSLEVLGARYAPVLQQHQQLMSATSLSPSPTVKGQHPHPPTVYEANVGGVRSDNVPLRIICNQYM